MGNDWEAFLSRTGAMAGVGAAAAPGNSLHTYAGLVLMFSCDRTRTVHLFEERSMTVGRDPGCDIQLADERISRQHARFNFSAGRWSVEDLDSNLGTYVTRQRIIAERALRPFDEIRFGNDLFKFVPVGAEAYARCAEAAVVAPPIGMGVAPDARAEIVGGPAMHKIAAVLARLAGGVVDLVLVGENGSEKEACARHLHALRGRRGQFVRVDLFGRGPDALADLAPAMIAAEGGTLFFEDVDALKVPDTTRTAHAPDFAAVALAVAGYPPRPSIDVHLVFGTREPPPQAPPHEPQHYALTIPPLRERKEDLSALCRARLRALGRGDVTLDDWFLCALVRHDFPGNVRELEQVLAGALARATGPFLTPDLLPPAIRRLAPKPK